MSKSDRPKVKNKLVTHEYDHKSKNWVGMRPVHVEDRPGMRPIETKNWPGVPPADNQVVVPPGAHPLLDKWWQRVEDELAEWEELGKELRGYIEKPEKSDRDHFDKQFSWRPAMEELPDREEVHPTESDNEYSQFSEAVLGKMDLVSDVPTYEVVIYDYKHKIWIDSKDMSATYGPIQFWSYIPEVVSIRFKIQETTGPAKEKPLDSLESWEAYIARRDQLITDNDEAGE